MAEHQSPIIAFVWRPEDMIPSVTQMAHRTGSRAIFDISMMGGDALRSFLRKTDSTARVRDIKISAPALMDHSLGRLLKETEVQNIWVECHPQFLPEDPSAFPKRLRELSEDYRCFPIIGDLKLLAAVLKDGSAIGRIVLKGCEASGFVSGETTLTLYSAVKAMLRNSSKPWGILVWGSVSTPEAAAALLSTGATGIVFESLHWLTDLVAVDDLQRRRLSNLRLDSTDLAGLDLQVPCRLFNKGNSIAFKDIKRFESSLCGAKVAEESRRSFADRVSTAAVHPLESHFTPGELIPLGVETAFAASFAERFGTGTEEAVRSFMDEIRSLCRQAEAKSDCFLDSPVAAEMGAGYPFIQGAMSCITDVPEFAVKVAKAGGLPTIALGLMDAETLDRRLGCLPKIMGEHPYAVNIISLAENPCRESQLTWIKKKKPRFVVIAGGDLSPLKELLECGMEVMYIAPDEALLMLALEAGVRYVICEGYEAGGHVGRHSTLTLAQRVADLKRLKPSLFQNCRIVFAGGIFNRETAFIAALLGADAIQMGTAYLATQEIVDTRALTAFYQSMILESPPGGTVVSGQDTGLRVRSLRSPRTAAVLSLEREFAAGEQDEHSFRTRIEEMTAGSLFVAARGMDSPCGALLDERTCLERGQFMSGACAGLISKVLRLPTFHLELAEGPLMLHQPFEWAGESMPQPTPGASHSIIAPSPSIGHGLKQASPHGDAQPRVAITGMSILNTLGKDPEEVWASCLAMKSGITLVPPSRWDHKLFYDPRPFVPDKTYCKVGAFLDFHFSRNEIGVPPHDFRTMTEATKLTLWLAERAIRESGILESDIPRERIAVIISQNSGEAAMTITGLTIRGYVHEILADINSVLNLSPEQLSAVERELKSGRMAPDDTTLLGRLNSAAAGFICNRYGIMGPSHSVSAACATSLVALHSAIQMIRTGVIDAAIIGGGEDYLRHIHFLEFSALGALFGLSGQEKPVHETSRPFDAERDGMVLGEGGGIIVIERESSARERGAPVHAVITGMGASNNHLGMVESSSVTQEIAIRASFQGVPYGPGEVDLVECHATSTRQGDVEEVRALKSFFNSSKRTVLTSFKSQIGHTLGASGVISLIRGVTAMKAGVFPPTLNYINPDPEIGLQGSGLLIAPEPFDWTCRAGRPRRLQVNAFGFGGTNYVVQLEQAMDEAGMILVSPGGESRPARDKDNGAADFGSRTSDLKQELIPAEETSGGPSEIQGVSFFRAGMDGRSCRLAVVADSEEAALAVLEDSPDLKEGGTVTPKVLRSLAHRGVFIDTEDLPALPLALVFPGQGAHYGGMGRDLYESFPVIREWMDRAAAVADFDLLHLLFHDREENLQKTRWQQPALFVLEYAIARYLLSLGIHPVATAGHSLGELTALCLAGVYSLEDGFRIVDMRARCMESAVGMQMDMDPGVMVAVDAPLDLLKELIQGREDGVHIGNINSPSQVVLSGKTEAVRSFADRLKEMGYRATLLRVSMAFHSPVMSFIHDEFEAFIDPITFHSPKLPVISNTTMTPYPSDPGEIRRILMAHLESPVHWMNNVQTLWNDYGVRLFVEAGPGDILSNLIADTISEPICIQTCLPGAENLTCRTALAQLFVQGHLKVQKEPGFVSLSGAGKVSESECHHSSPPPMLRPVALGPAVPNPMEGIVQREINRFVLDSFGRFLKPGILEAIRREVSPAFHEDDLESVIQAMFGGAVSPEVRREPPHAVESGINRDSHAPGIPLAPPLEKREAAGDLPPVEEASGGFASPGASPLPTETPAPGDATEGQEHLESLIQIIMDATGFERDEIQPDMDLKRDLSIRSSRLPIIMDAAERQFGITFELQDFIHVRTVKDIAQKISEIIGRHEGAGPRPEAAAGGAARDEVLKPSGDEVSLKRLVFHDVPLDLPAPIPIRLERSESVLLLSPDRDDSIAASAGEIFRLDHGVDIFPMPFMQGILVSGEAGFDIRTAEGARRAADRIAGQKSLAGMLIVLPRGVPESAGSMEDVSRLLRGLFIILQAFLQTPPRKFAVLIHSGEDTETPGRLAAEGMLGLFLSAAQEYPAVQFRTLEIGRDTDLRAALGAALDRGYTTVEMAHRTGRVFTSEGRVAPSVFRDLRSLDLSPGDVVVMSGGARGISAHLARSLVPFKPRLVFLGRTVLDPGMNPVKPGPTHPSSESVAFEDKALEITRTLADLHSLGIEASYHTCDVADPVAVHSVMDEVASLYGKIRGIIHGAGVLRDGFFNQMTPDDFSMVTDIKFLGAWNLFQAAEKAGLKFFVGLSSVAAIQGNPGQTNYAAANRMMSALIRTLRRRNGAIRFKALMLPPIEGAGMADDPDVRELMRRKGASYVHVNELAGLFCRELFVSPAEDDWVMFMRTLPSVKTARINDIAPPSPDEALDGGSAAFSSEDFPMIEGVSSLDIRREQLEATRSFAREKDLWIEDHSPLTFVEHPLVSAAMFLETFMEAARILYPHLQVRGARQMRFLDMIQCPSGVPRSSRISCRRVDNSLPEVWCEVSLATQQISPTGRLTDRFTPHCTGQVILDGGDGYLGENFPDFPVRLDELRTGQMDSQNMLEWYKEHSGLKGRYRVLEFLDGAGPGVVRGRTTYRQTDDFANLRNAKYQYSPYLFEALLQVTAFYCVAMRMPEQRSMIPLGIGEMRFCRKCREGEQITLEARMRTQDEQGLTWDARGLDAQGRTIMQVTNMRMCWVSD
ncbi:MAG: SDR family oxidoreductase [Syntrophobacteraceae bacterium]